MKTINKKLLGLVSLVTCLVPALAFAPEPPVSDLRGLIGVILDYLNLALELLIAVAVVMFVFYIIKYFMKPGDATERKEAGQYVMYSVIGFFVIISFWGIVNLVKGSFNFGTTTTSRTEFTNIIPTR